MANKKSYEGLSIDRIRDLFNEIAMAEKFNEEELKPQFMEAIQRYTGEYVPVFGADWDIILNEVYPIVQNNLPATFFRTPRAYLKPKNKTYITSKRNPSTGKMEEVQIDSSKSARTQEDIINYQLVEMKYKNETRKVLLDGLLAPHGVLWHGYKGDFGMTEEASPYIKKEKIFTKRISPMCFIKDPSVSFSNLEEGEWVGRIINMRLRDLVEDDRLEVDKQLIKGFNGFGTKVGTNTVIEAGAKNDIAVNGRDVSDIHRKDLLDFADKSFRDSASSKFVKVYEIYLRPTKKEEREGQKGWVLLLTNEQKTPLRVNKYKIKAEGYPAHLLMFNDIPDKMMGMSDVSTYSSIVDQKNVIINLQIRNAQTNTKVWVGINKGGADEEDIEKIEQGENTIVFFDGDTPVGQRMFVSSPGGGASSELYIIDQRIQRNLEDKSGVSDLKRGFLQSGEESATSVKIRAAGSSARPSYRQDIMADFLRNSIKYIAQLNKQFVPFKDAVRIIGSLDLEWSENFSKEDIQAEVDVDIDVISMIPENPEQELQRLNETLGLLIQGIVDPTISQKIAQEGKTITLTPLIEQILVRQRIKDPNIFRNIKPEESQGFVSVSEIRAAKANVEAALSGNPQLPSPPEEGQDHLARMEVYSSILALIQNLGDNIATQVLTQLMQVHQALLQQDQAKQQTSATRLPNLPKPSISSV